MSKKIIKKISTYWGHGKWGDMGSFANVLQFRQRGFKGVSRRHLKGKHGWTVYYTKKGKGQPYFIWNPEAKGDLKYG